MTAGWVAGMYSERMTEMTSLQKVVRVISDIAMPIKFEAFALTQYLRYAGPTFS